MPRQDSNQGIRPLGDLALCPGGGRQLVDERLWRTLCTFDFPAVSAAVVRGSSHTLGGLPRPPNEEGPNRWREIDWRWTHHALAVPLKVLRPSSWRSWHPHSRHRHNSMQPSSSALRLDPEGWCVLHHFASRASEMQVAVKQVTR